MKTLTLAVTAATAAAALATSASAATFADAWTFQPGGGISVVFGDNGLGIVGAEDVPGETDTTHVYDTVTDIFTDTFEFNLPNGIVGFSLSSIGFAVNSSLTLTSFTWNGVNIDFTNTPTMGGGNIVLSADGPFPVVAGGPQVLIVSGVGGEDAVFDGTATFLPAVIPEPATWALMIMGFGGAGAMLRGRRERVSAA